MIYAKKLTEEQRQGLRELQRKFEWSDDQLDYLIACMAFESGLNPAAKNRMSGAVGLIQFMPAICRAYGTTADEMRKKSFESNSNYTYSCCISWWRSFYRYRTNSERI